MWPRSPRLKIRTSRREHLTAKQQCVSLLYSRSPQISHGLQLRAKGNEAFKKDDFTAALACYTDSIQANSADSRLRANRAATYLELGKLAATKSQKCFLFEQCRLDA